MADFGEAGGDTLLWESDDLPEDTAESLSESSDFTAVLVFTETYKMFFKKSILAINGLNSILQKKKKHFILTLLWLLLFLLPVEAGTSLDFSVLLTTLVLLELLEDEVFPYTVNGFLL